VGAGADLNASEEVLAREFKFEFEFDGAQQNLVKRSELDVAAIALIRSVSRRKHPNAYQTVCL
jgi:hypothetical protein